MLRGLVERPAAMALLGLVCAASCGDNDAPADAPLPEPGIPDLQLVDDEMRDTVLVTETAFHDDDCAIVEACVGGAGVRRLLRFDTVSANRGTGDLIIGSPPEPGVDGNGFQWSPCHMHHHFADYTRYELVDGAGNVTAARKQSFCLQDTEQVQVGSPTRGYTCVNQGLSRGWADSYTRETACQWIDVTGLPSGAYTLRVIVNPLHNLTESNYDNNVFTVGVEI